MTLPNDVARCPGVALIDPRTLRIVTATSCTTCARNIQAVADVAQWRSDGAPRIDGGAPDMGVPWMSPGLQRADEPCQNRMEVQR